MITVGGALTGQQDTPAGRRRLRLSPTAALTLLLGTVALALRAYMTARPGLLAVTQYDDGPYFGSAVRLANGVLPYRDYAFVQPPGITLLMSPAALLTHLTGTAWGLVIGRALSVLAGTAAVVLVCLLVRHRGVWAVLAAGGVLAVYPAHVDASRTVLLEPWLVLFCLLGALAVFDGDRLAATGRLAWGGAAFGFAGTVKTWAVVPAVMVALICLPSLRRAAVFAGGVAAGFALPVLPFALAAPRQFLTGVVSAQLARGGSRTPVGSRLRAMLGLFSSVPWGPVATTLAAMLVAVVLAGAFVVAWQAAHQRPPALELFAVATVAGVVAMFLWPPYFSAHYAAFLGPFLGLAVALALTSVTGRARAARAGGEAAQADGEAARAGGEAAQGDGDAARAGAARARPGPGPARGAGLAARVDLRGAGLTAATLAVVVLAVLEAPTAPRGYPPLASQADRVIPAGACVVSDQASYLLLANRFTATAPGCPAMVDSLGTDLALAGGRTPHDGAGAVPAVRRAWRQAFGAASYVLFSNKNAIRVPWSPRLRAYFAARFKPVFYRRDYQIYARLGNPLPRVRFPASHRTGH